MSEDCVTFIACLPRCVPKTYARPNQSRGLDSESEPCKSWEEEEKVYWVLDFCHDIDENLDGFSGDSPIIFLVVKPTDDDYTGGGSQSDNDEEGFKDKEKMCSEDEPNQGGERSDNESFCHAVSEIKRCDPHGLGHHNDKGLLSTLTAITDSDRGDPTVDDEGMLSEVAAYVCSQMTDYTTTQIVRDYTLYAGLVGLDNAICFEDYLKVVEFIDDNGLGMTASEFLATFDVEDCLATCSGPGCVSLEECLLDSEKEHNNNLVPNEDGIIDVSDIFNEDIVADKDKIPSCIKIDDDTEIDVNFGTTSSDDKSADQEIVECMIDALFDALECVSEDFDITSIYISATTNGKHSATSNHSKFRAIDLSRINGTKMSVMTAEELKMVKKLQECLEDYSGIRENFGPSIKKKEGEVYTVSGHSDHIHFSINSDTTCTYDEDDISCDD